MVVLAAAYIFVYQYGPFPAPWNDVYSYLSTIVPALFAALVATYIWRSFQKGDAPRSIWLKFALALWCWAGAEVVWFVMAFTVGEASEFSLADCLWLMGYVFFGVSFLLQYRLILKISWQQEFRWVVLVVVAVLLASLAGMLLLYQSHHDPSLSLGMTFLEVFYPVGDLAMVIAALGIARLFGRGMWGRVWLSLLVFAISDGLYSWTAFTGMYAFSVENSNLLSLTVDATYTLAYLLVAMACYNQALLMRFGPSLMPPPRQEEIE